MPKNKPDDFTADRIRGKIADIARQIKLIQDVLDDMEKSGVGVIGIGSSGAVDDGVKLIDRFTRSSKIFFSAPQTIAMQWLSLDHY